MVVAGSPPCYPVDCLRHAACGIIWMNSHPLLRSGAVKRLCLAALPFASILWASAQPLLEVRKIADKTPEEVAAVLGAPCGEEALEAGTWRYYRRGEIKVMFAEGKANLIAISGINGVKLDANAIRVLGLQPEATTFEDYYTVRWEPHSTFAMVDLFAVRGDVVSALVKVRD